ncbi:hypothetical protein HDU97_005087 [Phlyctochytrium planicorne]|nr:hypothetical protein HDU97_005087 [Phlyctochytrium planicorne]
MGPQKLLQDEIQSFLNTYQQQDVFGTSKIVVANHNNLFGLVKGWLPSSIGRVDCRAMRSLDVDRARTMCFANSPRVLMVENVDFVTSKSVSVIESNPGFMRSSTSTWQNQSSLDTIIYLEQLLQRTSCRKCYIVFQDTQHVKESVPKMVTIDAFSSFFGFKDYQTQLEEIMFKILRFKERKLERGHGLMIHGRPGTGKTMLANLIAKESGIPVLNIDYASLRGKTVGSTEKAIKDPEVSNRISKAVLLSSYKQTLHSTTTDFHEDFVSTLALNLELQFGNL